MIVGFPKCGTTAIVEMLSKHPSVSLLKSSSGSTEIPWPSFRDAPAQFEDAEVGVHKFAAYIYNLDALKWLAETNYERHFVVCFRDPTRALVSWHNMHRRIANSDGSNHFAYREREFYANCSIEDYYEQFAASRLNYDKQFNRMAEIVPAQRISAVSQERMAKGVLDVADWLVGRALGVTEESLGAPPMDSAPEHRGYSDTARMHIPESIVVELNGVRTRLYEILSSGRFATAI